MAFTRAGPAEILRASQKDEHFISKFQLLVSDSVLHLKGTRFSLKYRTLIDGLSELLYYGITTLSGYQTLGEEYTGIIQTDCSMKQIPGFHRRLFMVLLECFGSSFMKTCLIALERKISSNKEMLPKAKEQILTGIGVWKSALPFIDRMHKAYFYYKGGTYQVSKRISGINYVLSRFWLKDRDSLYGFQILSFITTLQLIFVALESILNFRQSLKSSEKELTRSGASSGYCPLCLDQLKSPSVTPCGHVHCWKCILDWLASHDQCPVCRTAVASSRIVPMFNYH